MSVCTCANLTKRDGDATLVANLPPDLQGLMEISQRVFRLVQVLVRNSHGLQDATFLLLVVELNGQAHGLIQRIQRGLRIATLDVHAPAGQQCVDVLGIGGQHLGQLLFGLRVIGGLLV